MREKERAHAGEIQGRRSRVGDRQPSGAGCDSSEEKREGYGQRKEEKKRWNDK